MLCDTLCLGPFKSYLYCHSLKNPTKVSDREQDGLSLLDSDNGSLEKGEKQERNQRGKFKAEATNRYVFLIDH